jgi:hypothetical protein
MTSHSVAAMVKKHEAKKASYQTGRNTIPCKSVEPQKLDLLQRNAATYNLHPFHQRDEVFPSNSYINQSLIIPCITYGGWID